MGMAMYGWMALQNLYKQTIFKLNLHEHVLCYRKLLRQYEVKFK